MSDDAYIEAINQLEIAIGKLAKVAGEKAGVSTSGSESYAAAALDLAEARAWLRSVDQPHGGRSSMQVKGS